VTQTYSLTTTFPIGTAIVNLAGCVVIGLLAGLLAVERIRVPLYWREFVFVGLLGGFTTFSTFGLDTLLLARTHSSSMAFGNVLLQVLGGLAAVWLGYQLGAARSCGSPVSCWLVQPCGTITMLRGSIAPSLA
jgi:CrcB protein